MAHSPQVRATVLFIDDDSQHLKLYQWVIERGPFTVVPLLVGKNICELPEERPDIIALDYRLKGPLTAVEIAKKLNAKYPKAPIVVLSEVDWLPEDIAPHAVAFVSKGEPELLIDTLIKFTDNSRRLAGD